MRMESDLETFYKNKTIFLTGASGFLGKVIVEKLLRATETKRIYILVRPKRDQDIKTRIAKWQSDPLYKLLLENKPNAFERIAVIAGDCQEPDLGISAEDCELLYGEAEIVIHSAATVSFTEPMHIALDVNTRATRLMLQLAKKMRNLLAFVHVSTAFSNCVIYHITERFYPEHLKSTASKILMLRDQLEGNAIDSITTEMLGKFPNTYTYTKALAEQLVETEAQDLPICIFRPGSIIATSKQPVSGWIDNIYGPIALIYGVAFGVLRVATAIDNGNFIVVPVDSCANMVLCSAWRTAAEFKERQQRRSPPTIYNYVPHESNMIQQRDFKRMVEDKRFVYPVTQAIWYPFLHTTSKLWLFRLASIFYHLIPGFLVDVGLRLRGQKPRLLRTYKKIHSNIESIYSFTVNSWSFETHNTDALWKSLSERDRQLFEFDMKSLDWNSYFNRALCGMRTYLAKDDPSEESLQRARKRTMRFYILHRLLQFVLLCSAFAIVRWLFKSAMFSLK
ncbi:CG17562 [Drosophila busckii]|uniref:Fatty acyl-CoA reductase n=1 Tax=Drosophila busckii TaxID=30019 RepID=A0A0M4EJ26_DROBS|nr:fatty acyl-CoA reductase wat [Drosophila busckii]ALC41205.1 CG17562 [Drosophila busckii]